MGIDRLGHVATGTAWKASAVGRRTLVGCALITVLILVGACGSTSDATAAPDAADGVRVASFDFDESALLAEMYSQVLEAAGVPVVRLGVVGPREIVAPAMELGEIDLVPEYLGTALQYTGSSEPNPDTNSALAELRAQLEPRGLAALTPAIAQDKNVVVVTTQTAESEGLERISDLVAVAADFRFGGPAECRDRDLCLLGLERVYGLSFGEFVPQRSLEFTAEALRRGEIEVGLMFSTASQLESGEFVALVDDRQLQPAENVLPVVRLDALERWGPELKDSLTALAPALTTTELRTLNLRVSDQETLEEVARDWLADQGLI